MKNLYLKAVPLRVIQLMTLLAGFSGYSQFFEGFEATNIPPPGWTISDNGVGLSAQWRNILQIWAPYQGTGAAYIDRENIGSGNTSEDWLISPSIAVSADDKLSFFSMQTIMGVSGGTQYQVRVSTTSATDHNSFSTISAWDESNISTGLDYEGKSISLQDFAGQSIYIAFVRVHTQQGPATGGDRWILDNVSVGLTHMVSGSVHFSESASCDSNSLPMKDVKITKQGPVIGLNSLFTNANGSYAHFVPENNFTITPDFPTGNYFTITPPNYTFNFATTGDFNTADFCITPNGVHPDLKVSVIPVVRLRPGFDTKYRITYANHGTQTQSGNVTFQFNGSILNLVSTSETPATATANLLSWTFSNLQPFESRDLTVTLHAPAPPVVNLGDTFTATAVVSSPLADETYLDNTASCRQIAVNSADPNDKVVSTIITYKEPPLEYLDYTIHFQNIGTDSAQKVVVSDLLDSRFDLNSLIPVSASHPYSARLTGNRLEFSFDNINLAAAIIDEPASHGYVAFKIKPISDSMNADDIIANKASIFFDFNLPIVTNSTETLYYTILANEAFENKSFYALSPNPVKDLLSITVSDTAAINSMNIYNTLGQLAKSILNKNSEKSRFIDVSDLKAGTYFLKILSDRGTETKKFIKL